MKHNYSKYTYSLVLTTAFMLASSASAQTTTQSTKDDFVTKFPALATKSCQVKYQSELSFVSKLVDKSRAKKKVEELKTVRKDQDETIKTIFARIESKPENEDKKEIVENYKDDVAKILDDHRSKVDDLQTSIQISTKDIEALVRSSVSENAATTTKGCPITIENQKDIRSTSRAKLKKLVEDKKDMYIAQTKEIQQDFLIDVKTSLSNLSDELKK